MNKRIRKLVEQAGFRVFGDKIVAADQNSSGLATECTQRLIELVVRECVDCIENRLLASDGEGEIHLAAVLSGEEDWFEGYMDGGRESCRLIKERFGVGDWR